MTFLQKVKFAKKLIKEYLEKYPEKSVVSCSFGKDSMTLFHLAKQIKKDIPVVSVMTPFKFAATFRYKDKMTRKYKMNLTTGIKNEKTDMPDWWKTNPTDCCNYYKVETLREGLEKYDCWFSGLRKDERQGKGKLYVENPDRYGKIKVNPIWDFTELDIWRYLALHRIPVNSLYGKGYRSLGCMPCSSKEKKGNEAEREGRWRGQEKKGCGIHLIDKK